MRSKYRIRFCEYADRSCTYHVESKFLFVWCVSKSFASLDGAQQYISARTLVKETIL